MYSHRITEYLCVDGIRITRCGHTHLRLQSAYRQVQEGLLGVDTLIKDYRVYTDRYRKDYWMLTHINNYRAHRQVQEGLLSVNRLIKNYRAHTDRYRRITGC